MKLTIEDKFDNDQYHVSLSEYGHTIYEVLLEVDYKGDFKVIEISVGDDSVDSLHKINEAVKKHLNEFPEDFQEIQDESESERDWLTEGCDRYHEWKENN